MPFAVTARNSQSMSGKRCSLGYSSSSSSACSAFSDFNEEPTVCRLSLQQLQMALEAMRSSLQLLQRVAIPNPFNSPSNISSD